MSQDINILCFSHFFLDLPSRLQVNVKGSVRMVEPAYKPLTAPSCVSAPLSTLDTSVSWTSVNSVERASV